MTADLQSQISKAKTAKIAKLRTMIEICDRGGTAPAFVGAGGLIDTSGNTNTARYAGVTGTCSHSADANLIASWRRAALRQLEKLEDEQG